MVTRPIPKQGDTDIGILSPQIFQKRNGIVRISGVIRLNQTKLCCKVNRTVVSLLLPFIQDWNLDALAGFTPDMPTQIAPQ